MKRLLLTLIVLLAVTACFAQFKSDKKNRKMLKRSLQVQKASYSNDGRRGQKALWKMEKKEEKIFAKQAKLK